MSMNQNSAVKQGNVANFNNVVENSKDKTLLLNKGSENQAQVKKISKEGVFSHFKTD